jgi:NDP-sugar pyrophosphorylase family protein
MNIASIGDITQNFFSQKRIINLNQKINLLSEVKPKDITSFSGGSKDIELEIQDKLIEKENPKASLRLEKSTNPEELNKIISDSGEVISEVKTGKDHKIKVYLTRTGPCVLIKSKDETDSSKIYVFAGSELELKDGTKVKVAGQTLSPREIKNNEQFDGFESQNITDQAYIPAGGEGSRLYPLTENITKPAVAITAKHSILGLISKSLQANGLKNFFVSTFYKPESTKKAMSEINDANVTFIDHETNMGSAGGLYEITTKLDEYPNLDITKPLVVVLGDTVNNIDVAKLIKAHKLNNAALTLGIKHGDINNYRVIETDGSGEDCESGNITKVFQKKPTAEMTKSDLVDINMYIIAPEVLKNMKELLKDYGPSYSFKHIINEVKKQVDNGEIKDENGNEMPIYAQRVNGYVQEVGKIPYYLRTLREISDGKIFPGEIMGTPAVEMTTGAIFLNDSEAEMKSQIKKVSGDVLFDK